MTSSVIRSWRVILHLASPPVVYVELDVINYIGSYRPSGVVRIAYRRAGRGPVAPGVARLGTPPAGARGRSVRYRVSELLLACRPTVSVDERSCINRET